MSTAIGKKAVTGMKLTRETNQLRRDVARADQLFAEGLARLQSDYKERLRRAIVDEETTAVVEDQAATA
jgi:hypothetical protein